MSRYIGIEELLAGDARDLARFAAALSWQVDCIQEDPFHLEPECVDEILRFTIQPDGHRHTICVQALGVDSDGGVGLLQWRHQVNTEAGNFLSSTRWQVDLDEVRRRLCEHGVVDVRGAA